jgi:hypothetical protein
MSKQNERCKDVAIKMSKEHKNAIKHRKYHRSKNFKDKYTEK